MGIRRPSSRLSFTTTILREHDGESRRWAGPTANLQKNEEIPNEGVWMSPSGYDPWAQRTERVLGATESASNGGGESGTGNDKDVPVQRQISEL